jgi:hypothetical protein
MRWAGHAAQAGENTCGYRFLVGNPEGKRPPGMPRRRWEDDVKINVKETGW